MISLIVAMDQDNCIAKNGTIPWNLPDDLKNFKELTMGCSIIMGRKTYESIGKKLNGRHEFVLTTQKGLDIPGIYIFTDPDRCLDEAMCVSNDVFIIGGSQTYNIYLPECNRLYITRVHHSFNGDCFFPQIDLKHWYCSSKKYHEKDDTHNIDFTMYVYDRK